MKKPILLLTCIMSCLISMAAGDDTTATVTNILQAPSSPAANMLGIAPNDVARPTDPSAFMISAMEGRRNFSSFPSSYAVDIAPGWLFFGKHIKYEDLKHDKFSNTIWQNLVLSAGYVNSQDSVTGTKNKEVGFGMKISFLRGEVNKKVDSQVMQIDSILARRVNARVIALNVLVNHDSTIMDLTARWHAALSAGQQQVADAYQALITSVSTSITSGARFQQFIDSVNTSSKEDKARLADMVKKIDWQRYGWTLDLTTGVSMNFPDQVFDDGYLQKAGAWLTGGYTTQAGFAALSIVRYLYNPDKVYADENGVPKRDDLSTLDGGIRLLYANDKSNFTFGGEFIYRSVLNKNNVDPTWRYTINADYEFSQNKILTLSFGRDFDGTFHRDGNVIAAINLLIGFGNSLRAR